jgi:hypothetical protein
LGSFFFIDDSVVVLGNNGEKVILNLSQITNIRIIKNRNLSLNLILLYLSVILCFITSQFLDKHISIQLTSSIGIALGILISIFVKRFSYKLLVNIGVGGFNEFLVTKGNLACAESFVSLFKKQKTQQTC